MLRQLSANRKSADTKLSCDQKRGCRRRDRTLWKLLSYHATPEEAHPKQHEFDRLECDLYDNVPCAEQVCDLALQFVRRLASLLRAVAFSAARSYSDALDG